MGHGAEKEIRGQCHGSDGKPEKRQEEKSDIVQNPRLATGPEGGKKIPSRLEGGGGKGSVNFIRGACGGERAPRKK